MYIIRQYKLIVYWFFIIYINFKIVLIAILEQEDDDILYSDDLNRWSKKFARKVDVAISFISTHDDGNTDNDIDNNDFKSYMFLAKRRGFEHWNQDYDNLIRLVHEISIARW